MVDRSMICGMETLNEQEALRVLQAAAAMDAARSAGSRTTGALAFGRTAGSSHLQQQLQASDADDLSSPTHTLGKDVWREMAETERGPLTRPSDLDSWLDVFRATAAHVRNAWRSREAISFEALAFGWLAVARKHEPLPCAPAKASGEELTDAGFLKAWLSEAQWVQAAYLMTGAATAAAVAASAAASCAPVNGGGESEGDSAGSRAVAAASEGEEDGEGDQAADRAGGGGAAAAAAVAVAAASDAPEQRLIRLLGLQPADLLACCPEPAGARPAFFLAVHHNSRTIRLVIRSASGLPDLLTPAAGGTTTLGAGHVHRGMLEAAQQLLAEEAGRLRAAVEAHPEYGLRCVGHSEGAGIAALLALLVALEGARGTERLGSPSGGLRATCFSPPAVMSPELAEPHAGCIDSVVYHADLVSRCTAASLRRLIIEMSGAAREVLARGDLGQALRRSGSLGLANHIVAAALCRGAQPQDSASGPLVPAASLGGVGVGVGVLGASRSVLVEGLGSLGGALTRPPPAATAIVAAPTVLPSQLSVPVGQPGHLVHLKLAASGAGPLEPLYTVKTSLSGGSPSLPPALAQPLLASSPALQPAVSAPLMPSPPPPPLPPPAAPPMPLGLPNGTLPPLNSNSSLAAAVGGGCGSTPAAAAAAAVIGAGRGGAFESPRRVARIPIDAQGTIGVLSPPPLVAAAAAAAASAQSQQLAAVTAAATATGPTPPRRVLLSVSTDSRELRATCASAAASATPQLFSDDGGSAVTSPTPLQVTPLLLPAGAGALPLPLPLPVPVPAFPGPVRRDTLPSTDGTAVAAAAAGSATALPPLLPPMLPLPSSVAVAATQPQSQLPPPSSTRELMAERSLRHVAPLQLPPQVQQLQALRLGLDGDRAPTDEGPELLVPGTVHVIERKGADAGATFRLLRDVNRLHLNRVLLKRSMLRDHLLSHYVAALDAAIRQR